jgi:CRISPR system Cascade subunit CasD
MRFLLFTLFAPLASHGEIAVGERRMSWDRPGRSAILGLVAAALGVDRGDEETHRALDRGLWFAVRTEAPGRPFIDYHTTQVPGARRNRQFATRRHELAVADLNTILSYREWRSDALYIVALWERAERERHADLDRIKNALAHPVFPLYLGRKAAPLGWPMSPRLIEAAGLIEAMQNDSAREDKLMREWLRGALTENQSRSLAFDADATGHGAPEPERIVNRRDRPVNRGRWQFAERREGIIDRMDVLA